MLRRMNLAHPKAASFPYGKDKEKLPRCLLLPLLLSVPWGKGRTTDRPSLVECGAFVLITINKDSSVTATASV